VREKHDRAHLAGAGRQRGAGGVDLLRVARVEVAHGAGGAFHLVHGGLHGKTRPDLALVARVLPRRAEDSVTFATFTARTLA